ncbi:hypothetical protein TWF281_005477 [Arthrobotrys megalospora]
MAPITSFPSEILLNIFHQLGSFYGTLNSASADIIRVRQVCKRWRILGQDVPIRYFSITIDEVERRIWKFARSLLYDVSFATQIKELFVRWSRRRADTPGTFTTRWKWTKEDREQIEWRREAMAPYISSATFDAMLEGVNSESLLPFICYYTTQLEYLDLGFTEALLVARAWYSHGSGFYNIRKMLGPGPKDEGFKYIEDEVGLEDEDEDEDDDNDSDYDSDYDSDPELYDKENFFLKHMPPEAEEEGALWFHLNMGTPGDYLPGLRRVVRLENRNTNYEFPLRSVSGWSAKYIAPLLFLPNLEILEIEGHATIGGNKDKMHYPLSVSFEPYRGLRSKVKRLQLADGRLKLEDYDAIAELTGNLDCVEIYHSDYHNEIQEEEYPYIVRCFRDQNRSSLALSRVSVNNVPGDTMEGV